MQAENLEKARENPAFQESRTGQTSFSQEPERRGRRPVQFGRLSSVRRRPVQFYHHSGLVLLFVAVQFSSAVSRLVRLSVEYSGKSELEQQWLTTRKRRTTISIHQQTQLLLFISLTCTFDKDSAVTIHIFMYTIDL